MKNECPNCGNSFLESDRLCKYCGTANERYVKKTIISENNATATNNNKKTKSLSFGCVFMILFVVCWPVALFYLAINLKK